MHVWKPCAESGVPCPECRRSMRGIATVRRHEVSGNSAATVDLFVESIDYQRPMQALALWKLDGPERHI